MYKPEFMRFYRKGINAAKSYDLEKLIKTFILINFLTSKLFFTQMIQLFVWEINQTVKLLEKTACIIFGINNTGKINWEERIVFVSKKLSSGMFALWNKNKYCLTNFFNNLL